MRRIFRRRMLWRLPADLSGGQHGGTAPVSKKLLLGDATTRKPVHPDAASG